MAWKKGQSGNPSGTSGEKVFASTLRLVMAEIDEPSGKRKLRRIVEQLADAAIAGEAWAIQHVADRLDGKPAQESTVTIDDKRDAADWTRAELVNFLNNAKDGGTGTAQTDGCPKQPDQFH